MPKLIIPGTLETLTTGVLAAAEDICPITGGRLRVQFLRGGDWEFSVAGMKSTDSIGWEDFYHEARAVIAGYLKAAGLIPAA